MCEERRLQTRTREVGDARRWRERRLVAPAHVGLALDREGRLGAGLADHAVGAAACRCVDPGRLTHADGGTRGMRVVAVTAGGSSRGRLGGPPASSPGPDSGGCGTCRAARVDSSRRAPGTALARAAIRRRRIRWIVDAPLRRCLCVPPARYRGARGSAAREQPYGRHQHGHGHRWAGAIRSAGADPRGSPGDHGGCVLVPGISVQPAAAAYPSRVAHAGHLVASPSRDSRGVARGPVPSDVADAGACVRVVQPVRQHPDDRLRPVPDPCVGGGRPPRSASYSARAGLAAWWERCSPPG